MAANKFRPHHPAEYAKLMEWAAGAHSILEIGSRYGFTLLDFAHGAKPGARIVAVDWPGAGDWGNADSEKILRANVERLRGEGYDAHLFVGDSADREIVKKVTELAPFDLVFIDGDHRYSGAWWDWVNYGPLGGQVAFHDIRQPQPGENQNLEVWRLWRDLKEVGAHTREFIAPDSKMGIGLVG